MIRLTRRDLQIMRDLYENVQLSFSQICKRHFSRRNKATVQNRISKLLKKELLKKYKFTGILTANGRASLETVYQLSAKGGRILEQVFTDLDLGIDIPRLSANSLNHDLLLTEVLDGLRRIYPEERISNSRLLDRVKFENLPTPDAVMAKASEELYKAVELELTAKSDRRYRDLILKYRLARKVEKIVYVVARPYIAERIVHQMRGRKVRGLVLPHEEGKFLFLLLKDVMNQYRKTPTSFNRTDTENLNVV